MNMTITGTKPEKSRMIATGEEAHNTRRPTRMYQRTSSLHTPSFISQPVVFHPSSFPGEHDPPFRPIPPELEIGPTQLPPLSSILFVQSPSSPRPSSSPLGRFDVYYPPRSGTSPRAHCNQATLLQGQSPFAPNLPAGGERLHGPPVTYAPSLSSSHIDRPQQNFPVPPSRTHPGGQHSYSGQSSRSRPYPSQRLPPEARRLHPPLESPLDQLSPRIRISQPLYNYTPRPQYRSLLYQPLFIPTEIESKVSLDPDGVTVQSHHRAPASLHFQPQNRPVTRGPASSTTPFPDTPFVLIPHSQFPASDVFANCYSPTRLRTGNPWSNMHSSISSYTEPHGSHPDRPRDFEGFASSSEPRDYRRHHSYTGRYTTPPPPPPPLSPVYHTRSTSVQSLDSPPYAQHPTVKLPAKRRKPPDPYSNYANMLGDIINQHKRRKMALQEIYILLQERYADHFPEDDDATGSGNGWRVNPLSRTSLKSYIVCSAVNDIRILFVTHCL